MTKLDPASSHYDGLTPCLFVPLLPHDPSKPAKQPQHREMPENFPTLPSDWVAEFETFASADGKETLFAYLLRPQNIKPKKKVKALVVLHGQGEHGSRYFHWPHYLKDEATLIYILEHRGHGHSTGARGHVDHFDRFADDAALAINRFNEYLIERFGGGDIHLFGHSMGGLIALRTVLSYRDLPISSVILSNPMIDLAFPVPQLKVLAGRALKKVLPTLPMSSPSLWDKVSRDESVCDHYRLDAMNHSKTSPAFFFSYLEVKKEVESQVKSLAFPCFIQVGMGDLIIAPDSVIRLYKKMKIKQKRLKKYPKLYHELYNEPEKEKVFDDLKFWLNDLVDL